MKWMKKSLTINQSRIYKINSITILTIWEMNHRIPFSIFKATLGGEMKIKLAANNYFFDNLTPLQYLTLLILLSLIS